MKKAIITCSNSTIELYEFVEDFYLVSQKANTALELLRQGLPTWGSPHNSLSINQIFHPKGQGWC